MDKEAKFSVVRPLVLTSNFALNNSITKNVSVGIDLSEEIIPSVQMYGVDSRRRITLRAATWSKLVEHLEHILSYFDHPDPDLNRSFRIIECDDLVVSFSTIHDNRSVIFDQNSCRLVMHAVTVRNLSKSVHWINEWLDILCRASLQNHLNALIKTIADNVWTDLMKNSYNTGVPSEEEIRKYILKNFSNIYAEFKKTVSGVFASYPFLLLFYGEIINSHTKLLSSRVIESLGVYPPTQNLFPKNYYVG